MMNVGDQSERASKLGERINGHPGAVAAALPELAQILKHPDNLQSLISAIDALGHAWDPRAAAVLLTHVDCGHPEGAVRLALARALPGGASKEPERDSAIHALLQLSSDEVAEVRNWACFGLGQLEADTVAVRDALAARLDDDDRDTRAEALTALANLADPRALPACVRELEHENLSIGLMTLKAATVLADPALLPSLTALERHWSGHDPDEHTAALAEALRRCRADNS